MQNHNLQENSTFRVVQIVWMTKKISIIHLSNNLLLDINIGLITKKKRKGQGKLTIFCHKDLSNINQKKLNFNQICLRRNTFMLRFHEICLNVFITSQMLTILVQARILRQT